MHPLARHLTVGSVTLVLACGLVAASWWIHLQKEETLADRLPADAVLVYVSHTSIPEIFQQLKALAPALPPVPEMALDTEAFAAVRLDDGSEGWIFGRRSADGRLTVDRTTLTDRLPKGRSLARDPAFRALQAGWEKMERTYIAFPRIAAEGNPLASFLSLQSPIAIAHQSGALVLRAYLDRSPFPGKPIDPSIFPRSPFTQITLPSLRTISALQPLLTPNASLTLQALGTQALARIADGMSLQYDLAPLLKDTTQLTIGTSDAGKTSLSLEGYVTDAVETDRTLRSLHEHAAAGGRAMVKTVTYENFTLQTLTQANTPSSLDPTTVGGSAVLRTEDSEGTLLTAQSADRFIVTTDPVLFYGGMPAPNDPGASGWGAWKRSLQPFLAPLWPSLQIGDGDLTVLLTTGRDYAELTVSPVLGL